MAENDFDGEMELDVAGKFIEFTTRGVTSGRVTAWLASGAPWGGAILQMHGTTHPSASRFFELASGYRLSAEGINDVMDLRGVRRLRVVVGTASSTSGARVYISLATQNLSLTLADLI